MGNSMQKGRKIMHFLLFMISHMKPLPGDLVVWGPRGLEVFAREPMPTGL